MPIITQNIGKDYLDMYSGYNSQRVGMGLINPNIYSTPEYQKKKIQNIVIGGISDIVYSGMEHDTMPTILTIVHENSYNTILAYNLNYIPQQLRQAILKFVLDSNAARIKSNQPLIVDYHAIKKSNTR